MVKKQFLVLAAAGIISMATFATAQDSQSNDAPPPPAQNNERHHGMPDPAQRASELGKHLNLTSDQQAKVLDALQSERSQMESLHQDSSMSQQDRRAKMMNIRQTTDSQIRSVLDANQQKKWDQMMARRAEHMHNHDGNGGSDQAPQQQQ
jgi:Spy/CpxP family protein refolding chaperone